MLVRSTIPYHRTHPFLQPGLTKTFPCKKRRKHSLWWENIRSSIVRRRWCRFEQVEEMKAQSSGYFSDTMHTKWRWRHRNCLPKKIRSIQSGGQAWRLHVDRISYVTNVKKSSMWLTHRSRTKLRNIRKHRLNSIAHVRTLCSPIAECTVVISTCALYSFEACLLILGLIDHAILYMSSG